MATSYYCTGCRNRPDEACCHVRPDVRTDPLDCRCAELGLERRTQSQPEPPAAEADRRG